MNEQLDNTQAQISSRLFSWEGNVQTKTANQDNSFALFSLVNSIAFSFKSR